MQHFFVAISAFAFSFGLLAAAISRSSDALLIGAALMIGVSFGGSIGFLINGKNGVGIGGAVGIAIMLFAYSPLPTVQ